MRWACVVAPVAEGHVRATDLSVAVFTTLAIGGRSFKLPEADARRHQLCTVAGLHLVPFLEILSIVGRHDQ